MKKRILGIVLVLFVASLFFFSSKYDLPNQLFQFLGMQQIVLQLYVQDHLFTSISIYFISYILAAAFSLPIATILTLGAGAIFGFWIGLIIVSCASTIGATLAFLVARFLFQDFFEQKFSEKISTINKGLQRDGAFYLFTLRLIPIFPFFAINIILGLTKMRTLVFFFISQIGMLPGTAVYVNAGMELGQLESIRGILSPTFILSFALLGIFPWIARAILRYVKKRKIYKKYKASKKYDYNIIVIGAGSGGLVSSYIGAALKAKVLLIEKNKMGGDCLNTGCVPSKAFIRSAKILSYAKRAKEFGFNSMEVQFDFSAIMERVQRVIKKVEPHDSVERYTSLGVECIQGKAKILDPWRVQVDEGTTYTSKNIIIATGAGPLVPPISGLNEIHFYTTDTIWNLRTLPKQLLVLGGGPIGSEIAQCFQRFGSQVTIVDMSPTVLAREDADVSKILMEQFKKEGVELIMNCKAKRFKQEGESTYLICEENGKDRKVFFDTLLVAVGRKAHVKGFGIEQLQVQLTPRNTIQANELLQTNYPNIYVCGDVVGPYQFTHTAAHQAWYATVNALFRPIKQFSVDYSVIPWCTYTDPEIATVGLTEKLAKEKNVPYERSIFHINELDRAIADEEDKGFIKVLTVPGKDKILGCTIVGHHAGDLIVEYISAMKHGIGLNKILQTIHIYPTLAESNKYVAGIWRKAHTPERLLSFLEKFHTWRRNS